MPVNGGKDVWVTIKKEFKKFKWVNFLLLTAAGIINAIGVTLFIAPVGLYDSGVSGTSICSHRLRP